MSTGKNGQDRQEILEALQLNMNEEIRATLQYVCHRIAAKHHSETIAESFKSAALDEMAHILYFSDLIKKYGGIPRLEEWSVDKSEDLQTMLEADIRLEKAARERYQDQLEKFKGEIELVALISGVLVDEEDHETLFTRYRASRKW